LRGFAFNVSTISSYQLAWRTDNLLGYSLPDGTPSEATPPKPSVLKAVS
jgi:hypothetical protein